MSPVVVFIKYAVFVFILSLTAVESLRPPRFLDRVIGVDALILLPAIIFLVFFVLFKISKKEMILSFLYKVMILSLLLLLIGWGASIVDVLMYANYSYTKLRITPSVFVNSGGVLLIISLFLLLFLGKVRRFLFFSTAIFLSVFAVDKFNKYALANSDFNFFDGAISYLGNFYSSQGFIPYKDFGFPYPPLRLILMGKIIPFTSIIQRDFIFSLLVLFLFVVLFIVVSYKRGFFYQILPAVIMLFSISLFDIPYDPFVLPLIFIYFALGVLCIDEKEDERKIFYLSSIPLSVLIWFSRIDFSVFIFFYETVFFLIFYLKKIRFNKKLFIYKLSGHFLGIGLLLIYLIYNLSLREAFIFIFDIHRKAMKYRSLPLPNPSSLFSQDNLFFLSIMALVFVFFHLVLKKKKNLWIGYYILFFPSVFLPYLLGRSDWPHFLPFFKSTLIVIMLFAVKRFFSPEKAAALSLFAVVPLYSLIYANIPKFLPDEKGKTLAQINEGLQDCQRKTEKTAYESIFVAKSDYSGYRGVSNSALYLIDTKVPPAGKFIHEEVNIHSDCQYGDLINSYLDSSARPMLVFVEMIENSKDRQKDPVSCGRIESWLNNKKYKRIGECSSLGVGYEIRLYE